jgi:hypothetical protein
LGDSGVRVVNVEGGSAVAFNNFHALRGVRCPTKRQGI